MQKFNSAFTLIPKFLTNTKVYASPQVHYINPAVS